MKTIYYINFRDKLILGRKDYWFAFGSPYDLEEIEANIYVDIYEATNIDSTSYFQDETVTGASVSNQVMY